MIPSRGRPRRDRLAHHDGDVTKLPKWAQAHIARLEAKIARLEAEAGR